MLCLLILFVAGNAMYQHGFTPLAEASPPPMKLTYQAHALPVADAHASATLGDAMVRTRGNAERLRWAERSRPGDAYSLAPVTDSRRSERPLQRGIE